MIRRPTKLTIDTNPKHIFIESIPEISAIYFALLQCGYNFFEVEKPAELTDKIKSFILKYRFPFFDEIKQATCTAYPYWPRAAILETATFYLNSANFVFADFNEFREKIMSANNISDIERDSALWEWIKDFPFALKQVICDGNFQLYLKWEKEWVKQQNNIYAKELCIIQKYLNICSKLYSSSIKRVSIVLNPIKCAYSADYHMNGDCFIFCSGAFSSESIIHEFLHHVVRNTVISHSEAILNNSSYYPGIDSSYYLGYDAIGRLNAFEEYFVRMLTKLVVTENSPKSLDGFIKELLSPPVI